MFGYLLKNLPAKYIYAGYSIRKSLTIMTSKINGRVVYDVFLYTYVDNYLTLYLQMENGKYKNVDLGVTVDEATAEDLISKHLARGTVINTDEYEEYDKDKIVGVFGLRNIEVLIKQVDEMKKADPNNHDVSLEAMLDFKSQYMGMEAMGVVNQFNKCLKYPKDMITVPPIKSSMSDEYVSLIGDEMDYFDFMSGKESDEIIRELKLFDDTLDGVGNVKEGKELSISKGEDGKASKLEVKNVSNKV